MPRPTSTHPRSRTHGPRRVNRELRRLLIKAARAGEYRDLPEDDHRWLRRVIDRLTPLIEEGDQVLSGQPDPREWRKAYKRQPTLL